MLDPTCGSGAFLFAALNILEPLYDACLERMQAFVDDLERSGEPHSPRKFEDFRRRAGRGSAHPNRAYFILKSIIVSNLYGVDIMEEAVEICKLRLFLKLVAQVDRVGQFEPLPDVDFNIRAGNTLVGYVSIEEVRRAASQVSTATKDRRTATQSRMLDTETDATIRRIEEDAEIIDKAFTKFHDMQTEQEMDAAEFADAKGELRGRLSTLAAQLDHYLAREYGVDPEDAAAYEKWRGSHEPFHWIAEFYGIMRGGGFGVIIGNPPYLERSKLKGSYEIRDYKSSDCRDIYAWFVERSLSLQSAHGWQGLIVPVSLGASRSFASLRAILANNARCLWTSHYANRPGQLFEGAQNRLTILLSSRYGLQSSVWSTRYHRWNGRLGERQTLFPLLEYSDVSAFPLSAQDTIPKAQARIGVSVVQKMSGGKPLNSVIRRGTDLRIYWVRVPGYFCQFFLDAPTARPEGGGAVRVRGEVI